MSKARRRHKRPAAPALPPATPAIVGQVRVSAASGYDAARRELAALRNFNVRAQHADADSLPGLDVQRARSRAMLMNAPLAAGAVNTVVTNVVGTGLRFSPQARGADLEALAGITREQVIAFERAAEREWRLFQRAEHCDAAGEMGFDALQELAFRAVLGGGDCFVPLVQARSGSPFDFALQLVEADRVSNPNLKADAQNLAGGVEFDAGGRPVAYHVAEIPRVIGAARDWRRLPAYGPDGSRRVLHLLHRQRIAQTRGVPYLAPVMATLKDLDRYTQAELTAAVLNACVALIGESPEGDDVMPKEGAEQAPAPLQDARIPFEPGMVLEGFRPGEGLKSFGSERPSSGFDPFVLAVLRQVGVALELPFELLVKHFTASYSAARAALLQAWGFFRMRRAWLAAALCQPVYEHVIANAIMRGRISAPGFLADPAIRAAWCGARWTGPSPGQLDPLKEVNAAEKRLALRLSTRTRETAEITGDDWEQTAAEYAEELEYMELLGIPASDEPEAPAQPFGQNNGPPMPPEAEDDADERGDSDLEAA